MAPILSLLISAAAAAELRPVARAQWLMGTICEITAYGAGAREAESAAFAEIARWDRVLSLYKENSELSALNRSAAAAAPFACSRDLWEELFEALDYARQSGGAFDPTILPVLRRGPSALGSVGFRKLALDSGRRVVSFTVPGMSLDFGGIGKGFALDRAARVLRARGVTSAMINFGGQILALEAPPGRRGWEVRVPGQREALSVVNASVSSSGNSERPGHIASPFTGKPVMSQETMTVVAPSATAADAWSTALFVLDGKAPPAFAFCALRPGEEPGPACRAYLP